jgi:hypothetical protein
VTIAKRPFGVGRDGETYKPDLVILKSRIFLQKGLDMSGKSVIGPSDKAVIARLDRAIQYSRGADD